MNIKDISIKDYLAERNIHPAKTYGHYGMYIVRFVKTEMQVSKSITG
jgi:hypothetical protein